MDADSAQTAALKILGWIASDDELLPVFLGASGVQVDDLKTRAGDPEFLASLVDFVMMDDAWIVRASEVCGWPPEEITIIRAGLPGGDQPHWT